MPLDYNPAMTADFFDQKTGNPSLALKLKRKKDNAVKLAPSQVPAFIRSLPIGVYHYVILKEQSTAGSDLYYLKLGKSNHALVALSRDQALQVSTRDELKHMLDTVCVAAAGDVLITSQGCHLNDQSGGFHHKTLSQTIFLEHRRLIAYMCLLEFTFVHFITYNNCENIVNTLTNSQLTLLQHRDNRVALYQVFEKLVVLADQTRVKCLSESLNNHIILAAVGAVLLSRSIDSGVSPINLFQSSRDLIPSAPTQSKALNLSVKATVFHRHRQQRVTATNEPYKHRAKSLNA